MLLRQMKQSLLLEIHRPAALVTPCLKSHETNVHLAPTTKRTHAGREFVVPCCFKHGNACLWPRQITRLDSHVRNSLSSSWLTLRELQASLIMSAQLAGDCDACMASPFDDQLCGLVTAAKQTLQSADIDDAPATQEDPQFPDDSKAVADVMAAVGASNFPTQVIESDSSVAELDGLLVEWQQRVLAQSITGLLCAEVVRALLFLLQYILL